MGDLGLQRQKFKPKKVNDSYPEFSHTGLGNKVGPRFGEKENSTCNDICGLCSWFPFHMTFFIRLEAKTRRAYALPVLLTRARRNQFLKQIGDESQPCRRNTRFFSFFGACTPHSPI